MRALSTIKGRLAVAMVFLGLLLAVIGGLGMAGMHASNGTARTIHENQMPGVVAVSMTEMYTASERITLDRAAIFAGTPDVDAIIGRSSVTRKRADDAWKQFAALAQTPATADLAAKFDAQRHAVLAIIDTGYGEVRSNDQTRIRASAKALQAAFAPYAAAGAALREALFEEARSSYAQSQAAYDRFQTIGIAAILAGLAAAGLAWWSLSTSIGRPLTTALAQFDAIASGDLRRELAVTSQDEMAQLLKGLAKMQSSLTQTVQAVRNGSESISVATREIASGNLDLSSRTEEQAAALQQTVASMDELIATVRANTEHARQASALATTASEIADRGSHVVSQVVTTMGEINDSSSKIADIISIIDGIAFQTNILALNAAVEAARAGEQGRGFAVVASEVRNLAQRSAGAAKEIKTLIDTSVTRVNSGTSLVGDAGKTMAEMTVAIQHVTRIMSDIASASVEQNQGLEQISMSVAQMDQVTQQNAALVEQAAAAAHSLEDQASMLRATVSVFQLTDRAAPRLAVA